MRRDIGQAAALEEEGHWTGCTGRGVASGEKGLKESLQAPARRSQAETAGSHVASGHDWQCSGSEATQRTRAIANWSM